MSIQVSQLFYYPIKSLGEVACSEMPVTQWGPDRDRRLMLVNEQGTFVTQRQLPKMGLISVRDDGHTLSFHYLNQSMSIPWPSFSAAQSFDAIDVTVWKDQVKGFEVSEAASAWFSKHLERRVRLVGMPDWEHRQVDLEYAKEGDRTGFSDGFPFLLISEASLASLQAHLPFELQMSRFRPNIVVSGCEAFAEDTWRQIQINDVVFDIVKPCSRCVIPTLDPATAKKQPEVMTVLLKHRRNGKAVYVGQNLIHGSQGLISVGDQVMLLQ